METRRMHHIGIVLPSAQQAHALMEMYGLEPGREGQTEYGGAILFTKARAGECPLEFIIPSGGKLAEFNGGKGGLHHICFEVPNLAAASDELRAQGAELLEKEGVYGGPHAKCNFVRPRSSHGILVELMEISPDFPE
ncbi:VOC family protein [Ruminococcaceae bacterium OttesenSCG-928-D13]|nr:VOC family protein [Ruminococcaceae bacterium OttesenSCG-928-D13]